MDSIPIGRSLPNYSCLVLDQFLQHVIINQVGDLFVGGVGVFAGYLARDDLTSKVLIDINDEVFYRTGDLVRLDNKGRLHYRGRKDFQVKLHGQRIELGEIERCLFHTSISACVVMKWGDDHLVAYVQSSNIDEEQLRKHCQSHLPPYMVPSIFIILNKLPLNANGKIDRKRLPPPLTLRSDLSHLSLTHSRNDSGLLQPASQIEILIHKIWCDIFQQSQISIDTNIFTIGGHSLLLMQLFHRYKTEFHLETNSLSMSDLFQQATIFKHAQLIHDTINTTQNNDDYHWSSLHLTQARASFAQERIFLDEHIRFSSRKHYNIYAIPLLYQVLSTSNHVSITRLHQAFRALMTKHNILRTALDLDTNGIIIQRCLDANESTSDRITLTNLQNDDRHINEIVEEILSQADLFDLSKGHVMRCHFLRRSSFNDADLLTNGDFILITIHHAVFDGTSTSLFIHDLSLAYETNRFLITDDDTLQYIDYSVHEHIMNMTSSRDFWQSQLERYNSERSLSLPFDRQRLSTDERSGLAWTVQVTFNNTMASSFVHYASSHNLTYFQLGLATFYIFLFKLTHGQTDLCISSINANRYRSELVNMIGMFVSTLPYRLQLDAQWSLDEVVEHVREKCLAVLEHSHYPLQHILADFHLHQLNVSFLETMFDFITVSSGINVISLNTMDLDLVSFGELAETAKVDFMLSLIHNPLADDSSLSFSLSCSRDLFEEETVATVARRLACCLDQLFSANPFVDPVDSEFTRITRFNLILLDEAREMEDIVFCRQISVANEGMSKLA